MSEFSLLRGDGSGMEVPISQCLRAAPAVKSPSTSGLGTWWGESVLQRPEKALKPKMQVEAMRAGVNQNGGVEGGACSMESEQNPVGL